jgi:hypothetical protein
MLSSISSSREGSNDDFGDVRYSPVNPPIVHDPSEPASQNPSSPRRRQRRRLNGSFTGHPGHGFESPSSPHSAFQSTDSPVMASQFQTIYGRRGSSDQESLSASDSEDEVVEAVGQLSLNEDEQVRYHGKASGLHLLGVEERVDGRNEGGIW